MPFRGVIKQKEFDDPDYLSKECQKTLANTAANTSQNHPHKPQAYPGACLSFNEAASIENKIVNSAKHSHLDASCAGYNFPQNAPKGGHTPECWLTQRQSLWKAYAKGCEQTMRATPQCKEPLRVEYEDVPKSERAYSCECGAASRKYAISVFAGNVSWRKM